jgi:hypothetical protein
VGARASVRHHARFARSPRCLVASSCLLNLPNLGPPPALPRESPIRETVSPDLRKRRAASHYILCYILKDVITCSPAFARRLRTRLALPHRFARQDGG